MKLQSELAACPNCNSAHVVEDSEHRHLCLYCHSLLERHSATQYSVVGQQCTHCAAENTTGAQLCQTCNRSLATQCLKCGAQMAVWHEDCQQCGTNQGAYRQQQARRQTADARRATARRHRPRPQHRPHAGLRFWRIGWLVWLVVWARYLTGAYQQTVQRLSASDGIVANLFANGDFPRQLIAVSAGVCIFGIGTLIFLVAALPSYLSNRRRS